MSGRNGGRFPWHPNRTQWMSKDDGATFSAPGPSQLVEDAKQGCSAGLASDPYSPKLHTGLGAVNRLFFSEPAGPGRIGLTIHCSLDGGLTWPKSIRVGGAEDAAAYSSLRMVEISPGEHRLLVVWEMKPNFRSALLETEWCK